MLSTRPIRLLTGFSKAVSCVIMCDNACKIFPVLNNCDCVIIGIGNVDEYEKEVVFEIIPVPTRMYLQLHACEPYKTNHNAVDQNADNLEVIYLSRTCI